MLKTQGFSRPDHKKLHNCAHSCGVISVNRKHLLILQAGGEDPLGFFFSAPVGIQIQGALFGEFPAQGQLLTLPGFGKIADGELLGAVSR